MVVKGIITSCLGDQERFHGVAKVKAKPASSPSVQEEMIYFRPRELINTRYLKISI